MKDIITIGDTTEDIFLTNIQEAKTNKTKTQLIIKYPTKLIVKHIKKIHVAGNSANVAVGTSRLGLKTAIYTEIGKDQTGNTIKKTFKKEKISTKYIQTQTKKRTNYSVVLQHKEDRTILVYHEKRNYKLPKLEKSKWIYYSSIGEGYKKIEPQLINHIKKHKIKLAYNPGSIQLKDTKNCKKIIKNAHLTILNKEETKQILKTKENNIKKLLQKLKNLKTQIAIITDGPKGSYTYDGKNYYYQKTPKIKAKERTGSGDAYSTGIKAAQHNNKTIPEAMQWATTNSTSTRQHTGPEKGLLTKTQLQKNLKKHKLKTTKL